MDKLSVFTPALAAASVQIAGAADTAEDAAEMLSRAANPDGGSMPGDANPYLSQDTSQPGCDPWSVYAETVSMASAVMSAMQNTLETLTINVASAAEGYLITDHNVVPVSQLQGGTFKP